jgi:D-alanyl-D-alanine carboxypeptidase
MTTLRYASSLVLLGLSNTLFACDTSTDSEPELDDIGIDAAGIAEVEHLADAAIAAGIPGLSVAILRDGQTVTVTRGASDLQSGNAITVQHRFRMGSIAKTFVASTIMQLVDEGALELDDSLDHWLPGTLPASSHVTIEQLLRQESGIFDHANDERHMAPYIQGNFEFIWEPEQLVALSNDHPPDFAPGERWAYSNINYVLLGLIIEKLEGDSLANVVQRRIVEPLGLTGTTMEIDSDMAEPFVHGYLVGLSSEPIDTTRISGSAVFGHGNLVSTALDIAHFYRELARGGVVSKSQLPSMFSLDPDVPSDYAMGLYRFDDLFACGTFIGHDGQTPGYDNIGYTTLDGRRQVVVSVSSSTVDDKAGEPAAHEAFRQLVLAAGCR